MFKHIHIVACSPRSGTTLLHEVMVTCFAIDKHYDHEIRFNLIDAANNEILLTKRPKDTFYMPSVIESVADLYVVYLMRDPRDVIVSRHGKDRSIYYSNIRLWRELHAAARKMYGLTNFVEVRYEEFVSNPDATQAQLQKKWPWLKSRHAFSNYHEHAIVSDKSKTAMHGVRPIAPTSVGRWQQNLPRIKGQQSIHGSLTPDLVDSGYEHDGRWEDVLADVEPDMTRSRYPERVYWPRRFASYVDGLRKVASYRRKRQ